MNLTRCLPALAFAISLASVVMPARADVFPSKPITMVVPYAPGGGADILGRALVVEMGKVLGQPMIVENRAGAGGNVGADHVARSARPDGYTLLFTATSLASSPSLMKKMSFDPLKDLVPVAGPITIQNVVVVTPALPVKNMQELLALARAQPGKLAFASSGQGTSNHLAVALFEMQAGVDMLHVPYKSAGEALPALMAGNVQLMFDMSPSALPHVKSGRLRALAVTGVQRSSAVPELPTVAEAGVPGYEFSAWFGLFAPAATPPAVVTQLHAAAQKAFDSPAFQERLVQAGAEVTKGTPQSFALYFRGEVDRWAQVVKAGRLPVAE